MLLLWAHTMFYMMKTKNKRNLRLKKMIKINTLIKYQNQLKKLNC